MSRVSGVPAGQFERAFNPIESWVGAAVTSVFSPFSHQRSGVVHRTVPQRVGGQTSVSSSSRGSPAAAANALESFGKPLALGRRHLAQRPRDCGAPMPDHFVDELASRVGEGQRHVAAVGG